MQEAVSAIGLGFITPIESLADLSGAMILSGDRVLGVPYAAAQLALMDVGDSASLLTPGRIAFGAISIILAILYILKV